MSEKEIFPLFSVAKSVKLVREANNFKICFTLGGWECATPFFAESDLLQHVNACVILASRLQVVENLLSNACIFRETFSSKPWPQGIDHKTLLKKETLPIADQYFFEAACGMVGVDYGSVLDKNVVKLEGHIDGKVKITAIENVDGGIEKAACAARTQYIKLAKFVHSLYVERTEILYFLGFKQDVEKFMLELAATYDGKYHNLVEFSAILPKSCANIFDNFNKQAAGKAVNYILQKK